MPGEIQKQYIGARYVPLLAEPLAWSIDSTYDYLTMVVNNRTSYISRKNVPAGTEITNTEYWAEIGSYDAHIAQLHDQLTELQDNTEFQLQQTKTLINAVDSYSKNHLAWLEKGAMPFFDGNLIVLHHAEMTGITTKLRALFSPTKTWTQTTTANIGWNTSNSFLSQLQAIAARADFVRTKATNVFIFYGTTDKIADVYVPYRNTIAYLHSLLKCKIYIIKSGWNVSKNAVDASHDVNDFDTHWLLDGWLIPWSLGGSANAQYTDEMLNNFIASLTAKFITGRDIYMQGSTISINSTAFSTPSIITIRSGSESTIMLSYTQATADLGNVGADSEVVKRWAITGKQPILFELGTALFRVRGTEISRTTAYVSTFSVAIVGTNLEIVSPSIGNVQVLENATATLLKWDTIISAL